MIAQDIVLAGDHIRVGQGLLISFQRTLRIPDDGLSYPLPPGLGEFPVRRAADYPGLPRAWRDDFLIPMYRREALWISFTSRGGTPNAVKVGIGGVDAIRGAAWGPELQGDPQNYIVTPDQPWLDGINSGDGTVRQFVAMPMGEGYTIEAQITGEEKVGGLQIAVFDPLPGKLPEEPVAKEEPFFLLESFVTRSMGIGAGGTLHQKIYPDRYGIDVWDPESCRSFFIHLLSVSEFHAITGEDPPPSPVDAATYTEAGFPWFELYDEKDGDIEAAQTLERIRSIRELDGLDPEPGVPVDKSQIYGLHRKKE